MDNRRQEGRESCPQIFSDLTQDSSEFMYAQHLKYTRLLNEHKFRGGGGKADENQTDVVISQAKEEMVLWCSIECDVADGVYLTVNEQELRDKSRYTAVTHGHEWKSRPGYI